MAEAALVPTGPKPKPLSVRHKERTGARKTSVKSKRSVPDEVSLERIPGGFDTSPPADLPPAAVDFWNRTVEILVEARVAQEVDWTALRVMAVQVARAELARAALDAPEPTLLEDLDDRIDDLRQNRTHVSSRLKAKRDANLDVTAEEIARLAKVDVTLSNLVEYRRLLEITGGMVALGSTGQIVEHPMIATERAAGSLVLRYLVEFGLTPSSRVRLSVAGLTGEAIRTSLEKDLGPTGRRRPKADVEIE